MKTYQETLAYIYGLARFGMRPGLERISATLRALGSPDESVRVVHVAGTNGKGSTAAFLASILAEGGYRAGLFTSPHLIRFTERFRINGIEMPESAVAGLADRVLKAAPPETTFFEIVTAMAFLYFAEEKTDLAIMEAGMGGRMDATNAATGILSVISPISLDHCQYLGDTLADIAREKSGIVKPGRPVVTAPQNAEVLAAITRCSLEMASPLYRAGVDFEAFWEGDGLAYRGLNTSLSGMHPGIPGRYQLVNGSLALCAAELLGASGFGLDDSLLCRGIESARWPGRMESFGNAPRILLDGAHNAAGAEALAASVGEVPHARLFLVAGVMGDKDAGGILAPLLPLAERVYAVSPGIDRAMSSAELATLCRQSGVEAIDAGRVAAGIQRAANEAGPSDLVLVCGSLFTVGEARAFLVGQNFEPYRG